MRILLADDHDLVRDTISLFLKSEGVDEVATAENLDDALAAARNGEFDLALLDYKMPGMNGLEGVAQMKAAMNGGPVAVLSGMATPAIAQSAIEAGAIGFVPKTMSAKAMIGAIRLMVLGEVFMPVSFQQQAGSANEANLTTRETEVLRALCDAKSNKEIARELNLQEVTIKLHVKTLCRKLDARNRTQAAMIARDRQLV
ncbi:response regulator transcription factor [Nioella sediminis]|uniref:response regulator transcription factor n=1 Tax=Nioella sediminis TaxID=1912092 RepID=UPI0008FD0ECB|nr:response regulator transcription factor [Nioella sediminis]TBX23224.1 chemotaxis protein CheY [Roseovarius sp. JS7-11]